MVNKTFLLAIDGMHIVLSRTALLDLIVSFWALVAFALLVLDRDQVRKRSFIDPDRLGHRPFRWLAAIALGCAIATKWSGLWFALFFGIMTIAWDIALRKQRGSAHPWRFTLLRDAPLTALGMLAIAAAVYLLSWTGWIRSDDGWGRTWASEQPPSLVPDWLRSLIQYHDQQLNFHTGLDDEHNYASQAWTWPLQIRPTSFYYESPKCGSSECSQEVLAIGTPLLWWSGSIALVFLIGLWFRKRNHSLILLGVAAGLLPWFAFPERTTFSFYSIVFQPWIVLAIVAAIKEINERLPAHISRKSKKAVLAAFILVIGGNFIYHSPIFLAITVTYDYWRGLMWFDSWI